MKSICFIFLLIYLMACHKTLNHPIPPVLALNVVNNITLCCDNNGSVSWVGKYFYEFQFNETGPGYTFPEQGISALNIADYYGGLYAGEPDTPRMLYFKYVGPSPLFDTSRITFRNNWTIDYSLPASFLNIPLFQARFVGNDSVFQTFQCSDTASIVSVAYFHQQAVSYDPVCGLNCGGYESPALPVGLTDDTLTNILSTYLSNDSLRKTDVHWGKDGSL